MENKFNEVYAIDVSAYIEKKGNLSYLSWAKAWAEFKKIYPEATYKVDQFDGSFCTGNPTIGYMVRTEVTADGLTYEMWLPVMDTRNKTLKNAEMFDINKTIMRCLTKNLAMFGLGLYIYAGEDLPADKDDEEPLPVTAEQLNRFEELGVKLDGVLKKYGIKQITQLTMDEANEIIALKEAYLAREKKE